MPHDPYKALYIHIPFCVHRCAYCDFTTSAIDVSEPSIDDYIDDLCIQIRRLSKEDELGALETVYIGGGTPSYIGNARLSRLLYTLSLSMHLTPEVECTMEANPDSLDERLINDVFALGVNRLSIGVQSFDDSVLNILGRVHDAAAARRAIELAKGRFENISIDLMCGIPGQSDESFAKSVQEAIALGLTHVSIYPLTIEEHTPLFKLVRKGKFPEPDSDVQARHMEIARDLLNEAGFIRYEVANYARPGFESRHNSAYWTGKPYLGLGLSAVTMTQNDEHRARKRDGVVEEMLDKPQMVAEDLMLAMRMSKGIAVDDVEAACGILPSARTCFDELVADGLVELRDGRFRPTELGWLCGNELYGRIFDLA